MCGKFAAKSSWREVTNVLDAMNGAPRAEDETRSIHNQRQQPQHALTDCRAEHGEEESAIHWMTDEGIRARHDQDAPLLARYMRGPARAEIGARPDREADARSRKQKP